MFIYLVMTSFSYNPAPIHTTLVTCIFNNVYRSELLTTYIWSRHFVFKRVKERWRWEIIFFVIYLLCSFEFSLHVLIPNCVIFTQIQKALIGRKKYFIVLKEICSSLLHCFFLIPLPTTQPCLLNFLFPFHHSSRLASSNLSSTGHNQFFQHMFFFFFFFFFFFL
jgi:hypothetical protein